MRSLLLEGNPQYAKLLKEFNKGIVKQVKRMRKLEYCLPQTLAVDPADRMPSTTQEWFTR